MSHTSCRFEVSTRTEGGKLPSTSVVGAENRRTLVCALIALLAGPPISMSGEASSIPEATPLDKMLAAEARILSAIQSLQDHVSDLASLARQINQADSGASNDAERSEQLSTQLISQFPGLVLLAAIDSDNSLLKGKLLQTDPTLIRAALVKPYRKYHDHPPSSCFSPNDVKFSESRECVENLSQLCKSFESNGEGRLSVVSIRDDLTSVSRAVKSPDDWLQSESTPSDATDSASEKYKAVKDLLQAWTDEIYYFCATASTSGQPFEAKMPSGAIPNPPAAGVVTTVSLEDIERECIEIDVLTAQANSRALKARYPDYSMVGFWDEWIETRRRRCNESIQSWCGAAYVLKEEVILAYVTRGCEIREVTAEDVDNDLQRFTSFGVTRADRLKHEVLRDQIDTCQAANGKGFSWSYQPPSLKECQTSGEAKPK